MACEVINNGTERNGPSWSELLNQARAGDARALGEVCERVRGYLLLAADQELDGGLRSKVGASDLVQQSMLEAHRGMDHFQGTSEAEFRTWIRRILSNNLVDSTRQYRQAQKRDARREVPLHTAEHLAELVAPQSTASSLLRRKETDEEMLRAVAALPERRRRVIEMRHRHGLSYAEIGEQLDISEIAARKLWSRAVEELRTKLAVKQHADRPPQPR